MADLVDFGEKLEAKHREKNDVSDSMDLTMKMIPVMVRAVDEMRSLGASDDKILRFLYATIDELQGS
jgi:hypothetical protein